MTQKYSRYSPIVLLATAWFVRMLVLQANAARVPPRRHICRIAGQGRDTAMRTLHSMIYRYGGGRYSRKRLSATLLLAGGLIAPLVHQTPAFAIICRSDPVMVVNGAVIDVVSTLETDPSSVREIDYQVTLPSGALLGGTTLTVGLGFPEHITYVFSPAQPWGSVQVAATVIAADGAAPFPLTLQVSSLVAGSNATSGTSDSTAIVSLDHILML